MFKFLNVKEHFRLMLMKQFLKKWLRFISEYTLAENISEEVPRLVRVAGMVNIHEGLSEAEKLELLPRVEEVNKLVAIGANNNAD